MKLLIQPADGVTPIIAAIKGAKKSVDIAIFRFDRKDIETALVAAAARGVRVTALIAFVNRGGAKSLRALELRFLAAGITVSRTSDDLIRYHGKYIIVDRRELYVLSFNFTRLDINRSRGFGIVTAQPVLVKEALKLFKADCMRTKYATKGETFVVSPANSRRVLSKFIGAAKKQLLIYDPNIADKPILRVLEERAKAGVEIRVIGKVKAKVAFDSRKLASTRLHTRTIIRDGHQAFVGSQSLRGAELDSRREVGLIIQDKKALKGLIDTFEADWAQTSVKSPGKSDDEKDDEKEGGKEEAKESKEDSASPAQVARAVAVFTKELAPLSRTVKKAVRQAVNKAGEDVLNDKDVKDTMKDVVKDAVKEAVKDAVHDAQEAKPAEGKAS